MPDPHVKRPQPYPPHVDEEYKQYKQYDKLYAKAKAKASAKMDASPMKTPAHDDTYRRNMEMARDRAHDKRVAANTAAAARSGFGHKYPYSYEHLDGKLGHEEAVKNLLKGAKNAAQEERKASRSLARR